MEDAVVQKSYEAKTVGSEICGRKTNSSNSVEFPAVGWRNNDSDGTLCGTGESGLCWSSDEFGAYRAHCLSFAYDYLTMDAGSTKYDGHSVRCVR